MLLRIRRVRLQAGQAVGEVARAVSVSPSQLSQIELGERRPSRRVRARLAAYYDIPALELFGDIDEAYDRLRELGGEVLGRSAKGAPDEAPPAR